MPGGEAIDVHRTSRVRRRRPRLATVALAAGVTALLTALPLLALPAVASATAPPPPPPADADARCDTSPTSYPGNGVPVPGGASCVVVTTADAVPVAEVWAWSDETGLHWYNYVAEGYTPSSGSALTMCATEDEAADETTYVCSTDSYLLLFTIADLFVTWPAEVETDLYFCESVDIVGVDGLALAAHACGTLSGVMQDEGAQVPPPTTPPATTEPTPTPTPSPPAEAPTIAATDPPADAPDRTTEPTSSDPAATPNASPPPAAAPSPPGPPAPVDGDPTRLADDSALDSAPVATPVDTASVALVGGAAFPVALVLALAVALAAGGVAVLAGPSALAAFRRRT